MTTDEKKPSTDINMESVKEELEQRLGETSDLASVTIRIFGEAGVFSYLTSMTNTAFLMDNVIKPLTHAGSPLDKLQKNQWLDRIREQYLAGLTTETSNDPGHFTDLIMKGYAALYISGMTEVLMIDIKELETRAVTEPTTQSVAIGPKDGFTESAETNISLIRRKIQNPYLRFEKYELGQMTKTSIYLSYVDDLVEKDVLNQIRDKIQERKMDSLFATSNLDTLFQSKELSLFPTVYATERPDNVCNGLIDKRVAIIVNGSPFVLMVPSLFNDYFRSPEDVYQWFSFGVFIRYLRYLSFLISLCMPALYIAITCYHQELIPTLLLTSIAAQRQGIPFPVVFEVLVLEITFEILREAGTRMPRIIGQSISIAGALVLGQAAVLAGFVSNVSLIVVSLTVISGFVSPIYSFGARIRLFRYGLIILGSILGLFGIFLAVAFLLLHLSRIEPFGIPYLTSSLTKRAKKGERNAA
ncbi:Spore germination protein B1 [Paenibacillus auburnensis]|uniref:Spore germination protein B1 n=1 Tax=Paenibacillus auburnensis TaxID=2905649 RepID=A0ABM9BPQ6_9BACL|nr:spore germination protein [Paenibacillus auburnensis]CAH1192050.1 Spore germination protein B1 [Paenibacillus auburnensis]